MKETENGILLPVLGIIIFTILIFNDLSFVSFPIIWYITKNMHPVSWEHEQQLNEIINLTHMKFSSIFYYLDLFFLPVLRKWTHGWERQRVRVGVRYQRASPGLKSTHVQDRTERVSRSGTRAPGERWTFLHWLYHLARQLVLVLRE